MISILHKRARLKLLLFIFGYIFSTVMCNIHNHQKHDLIEKINFNIDNYTRNVDRKYSFNNLLSEPMGNDIIKAKKKRHHRHSNNYVNSRGSHFKRNTNLLKPDMKRDYVSAIVGKDVQLDCKITELVHDDDKVKFFDIF
jgi:hypothetical protein